MDKPTIDNIALLRSATASLSASPKTLESKWFYDAQGSDLFEQITALPEYYPTRTEISILRAQARTLSEMVPDGAALIEIGSGASVKTRLLLEEMPQLSAYAPLDISADFLGEVAKSLRVDYPTLSIHPIFADFMNDLSLPDIFAGRDLVLFFPGSTIGNLTPDQAVDLLGRLRKLGRVSALILGADLVKDPDTLIAAYDDAAGVTAAFNRNLLARLNREAGATFEPEAFAHEARWNAEAARIEMHLVSLRNQTVSLGARDFDFAMGESIHTENSHKYTRASLTELGAQAGWQLTHWLTDADAAFSVSVLRPNQTD